LHNSRENQGKNIWNRLEHNPAGRNTRDTERYHPYRREPREDSKLIRRGSESFNKSRYGDSDSSSSWRVRGNSPQHRGRYREQTDDRRNDPLPKSNRVSPDSQRTILESHRYPRSAYQARKQSLIWQPVRISARNDEGRSKTHIEQVAERSTLEETEEDRRRRLKGKAIEVDDGAKETHTSSVLVANGSLHTTEQRITNIPENQVYAEKSKRHENITTAKGLLKETTKSKEAPTHDQNIQPATGGTDKLAIAESNDKEQETEEDLQLPSEEEMRQFEEQYASVNFEMDEEMLDEDDLLDEVENEEINEGQEREKTRKLQKDKPQPYRPSKRRGTRSPDTKGIAASKKLATRGRASPKGKLVKHSQTSST
ncbi:hypothetical protein HID58_048154, partial [Brassica napus]